MTAEQYEEKAAQCLRLVRTCVDKAAIKALRKLAEEYTAMAEAIRVKEAEVRTVPISKPDT